MNAVEIKINLHNLFRQEIVSTTSLTSKALFKNDFITILKFEPTKRTAKKIITNMYDKKSLPDSAIKTIKLN